MKGRVFGKYSITHKLGQGGMAQVWAAEHKLTGGMAAVKILLPEMLNRSEDGMRRRLINEAVAMAKIKHPGIAQVFDVDTHEDGSVYIVMELLKGETLKARIAREGALPLAQTKSIIRQLARATGAAHKKGIIHRDLKPDNIFIVEDAEVQGGERVKVLDFGLAKLTEGAGSLITKQGAVFGTPSYMAPEQCEGAANVDHRADIYSIGCIFFLCLCGRPPFIRDSYMQVLIAQKSHAPTPPRQIDPTIPADVEALILRLMQKKPQERVQTGDQLLRLLDITDGAVPRPLGHSLTTSPYSTTDEDSTILDGEQDPHDDGIEDLSDVLDELHAGADDGGAGEEVDDAPTFIGGGMSLVQLPRGLPADRPRVPLPGVPEDATLLELGVGDVEVLRSYPSRAPTLPAEPKTVPDASRKQPEASDDEAPMVSVPVPRELATSSPSPIPAPAVAPSPYHASPSPYGAPAPSPYGPPVGNPWGRTTTESEPSLRDSAAEVVTLPPAMGPRGVGPRGTGPEAMYRRPALPPAAPGAPYRKWSYIAAGAVIVLGLIALGSHGDDPVAEEAVGAKSPISEAARGGMGKVAVSVNPAGQAGDPGHSDEPHEPPSEGADPGAPAEAGSPGGEDEPPLSRFELDSKPTPKEIGKFYDKGWFRVVTVRCDKLGAIPRRHKKIMASCTIAACEVNNRELANKYYLRADFDLRKDPHAKCLAKGIRLPSP